MIHAAVELITSIASQTSLLALMQVLKRQEPGSMEEDLQ